MILIQSSVMPTTLLFERHENTSSTMIHTQGTGPGDDVHAYKNNLVAVSSQFVAVFWRGEAVHAVKHETFSRITPLRENVAGLSTH